MSIHDLLDKMESAEDAFLETEFLAPLLPGGQVRVRIAGVVCTLRVTGRRQAGWAILKPMSMDRARVVDEPSLRQIRDYLALFPAVRLLLVARAEQGWLALPAHRGDSRFQIEGLVRVHLVTGAEPLQRVVARFDGALFWFQEVDRRRSPAIAAYLREALDAGTRPEDLHRPTLTAEERDAYGLAQRGTEALLRDQARQRQEDDERRDPLEEARDAIQDERAQRRDAVRDEQARRQEAIHRDQVSRRLAEALAHGGAELASYIEQEDAYSVAYTVDGQRHRSTVRKDNLTVLSAGICLEGGDRNFDLQSLVGVLREGRQGRRIYRVGVG
jgi:hypothetical protein